MRKQKQTSPKELVTETGSKVRIFSAGTVKDFKSTNLQNNQGVKAKIVRRIPCIQSLPLRLF